MISKGEMDIKFQSGSLQKSPSLHVFEDESSDEILFSFDDSSYDFPRVRAATVDKLIERLTQDNFAGLFLFN